MAWAILDTSVYVDHWARGRFEAELERIREAFVVRHSAVVLSELRRGARTRRARRLVDSLFRLAPVRWVPTAGDWWEAGRLIQTIGDRQRWDRERRRGFQNDALIALTARRYGATVVTADRDFELLSEELPVAILVLDSGRQA